MWTKAKRWLKGLVSAVISGAAAAVGATLIDPHRFSLADVHGLLAPAVAGAIVGLANYLLRSPLPEKWDGADRRKKDEDNST